MKTKLFLVTLSVSIVATATNAADCCAKPDSHFSCGASLPASSPISDKSVYQLASTWTSDSGKSVELKALSGRPQVVAMFFARCQYACPLLVYKMKQVEAALPENIRTNVDFLLVSFDTEHDTPSELVKYRAQHELGAHWTLLHGTASNVQDLAAVLGIKYKQDAQGQFLHSSVLTVLNAQGEISYQEPGLTLAPDELVRKLLSSLDRSDVAACHDDVVKPN